MCDPLKMPSLTSFPQTVLSSEWQCEITAPDLVFVFTTEVQFRLRRFTPACLSAF